MSRKDLVILFLFSFLFTFLVGLFQHSPGYIDADYYYAGGIRLAQGYGFTETTLWNYLDSPQSLPHASHGYWYPLASLLAALGMVVTGSTSFATAKIGFVLLGGLIGPLMALAGYQYSGSRQKGWLAGLLGIFSGFYSPFISTTDNYGVCIVLGCALFLLLGGNLPKKYFYIGLVIGLLNLARSDSLLWLGTLLLWLLWDGLVKKEVTTTVAGKIGWVVLGYSLVMAPWMARNILVFGSPFSAAGDKVLWLTNYYDTLAWPASRVNLATFLASGWREIFRVRVGVLWTLIQNGFFAQVGILNIVWFGLGFKKAWTEKRVRYFLLSWVLLLGVMGVLFPYAASRGSFFHAGATVFPVMVIVIVEGVWIGFEKLRIGKYIWTVALVAIFYSGYVIYQSVQIMDWDRFNRVYISIEENLVLDGASLTETIMVSNPPGYFSATSRPAIIVPNETLDTIMTLAKKFDVTYILFDEKYCQLPKQDYCFKAVSMGDLVYLTSVEDIHIFKIRKNE